MPPLPLMTTMKEDSVDWHHPELGRIRGAISSPTTTQFRNLLYATIPERWKHSELVTDLSPYCEPDQPYDSTAWGPLSPQRDASIDFDFGLIGKRLPVDRTLFCDEQKCLNLVVSKPTGDLKGLPVLVFIHGGGFFLGGNSWPQYDLRNLVELSIKTKKPLIAVGINYRLGLLGFLASGELSEPQDAGNYGLFDQANALTWIKRHIQGFGGDPQSVTVIGESAGSISTLLHVLRQEPLFDRAMAMSGDPGLRPPQPLEKNEALYHGLLNELTIEPFTARERAAALRQVDWRRLVASPLTLRCLPTLNRGIRGFEESIEGIGQQLESSLSWCKTIVIGDCLHDATVFAAALAKPDWLSKFRVAFLSFFSSEQLSHILVAYDLNEHSSEPCHPGLLKLATDIKFYMPVVRAGQAVRPSKNLHIYHFHKPCPFDGPFKNLSGHVYDVAYFSQNYHHLLPAEDQLGSVRFGEYVIDLAYGSLDIIQEPTLRSSTREVMVWSTGISPLSCSAEEYDKSFRESAGALLTSLGVVKCSKALELYISLSTDS